MCDLEALCQLLGARRDSSPARDQRCPELMVPRSPPPACTERSWPPRSQTVADTDQAGPVTAVSSETTERIGSTAGADVLQETSPTATRVGDLVKYDDEVLEPFDAHEGCLPLPLAPFREPSRAPYHTPAGPAEAYELPLPFDHSEPATPKPFSTEAMRVLDTCEQLLSGIAVSEGARLQMLGEIMELKKRHARPGEQPSRSSIARHRRYTLGSDARRVLKGWVDMHIEDPYPSVAEKHQLANAANLSIKQVNDWFTNYRKRHWEDEMHIAGARRVL